MALYDAKIEKNCKKVEQLERNIKRDTEERRRLLSEIDRLRYLSLCEKLNCQGEELETVLAREHEQIQNMKARGMTDDEIDVEYTVSQEVFDRIAVDQVGVLVTVNGNFFDFGDGQEIEETEQETEPTTDGETSL